LASVPWTSPNQPFIDDFNDTKNLYNLHLSKRVNGKYQGLV